MWTYTCREKSGNIDLLRYRSQTLEERVRGYEQQEAALAELHRENKTLREHQVGGKAGGTWSMEGGWKGGKEARGREEGRNEEREGGSEQASEGGRE